LITLDLLPPGFLDGVLLEDVRAGLTATPKSLPSKWLYVAEGSALFEKVTELPEYYPARAERAILREAASAIAGLTGARTLIELGSRSSGKTRLLLDALRSWGTLESYVGVDVSESAVVAAGDALAGEYQGLVIRAVVADFEEHSTLGLPPTSTWTRSTMSRYGCRRRSGSRCGSVRLPTSRCECRGRA
jgi:L-histidine N-alpha-methyltransferase